MDSRYSEVETTVLYETIYLYVYILTYINIFI